MKKIILILITIVLCGTISAQYQVTHPHGDLPGGDALYQNPIFAGDYPDPSILRDGKDYYIVHSSFEYYPGLLIWHSTDLINWTPVANALHTYIGSVWAPDLVKHNGKYYIYIPAENRNYVIWADSIEGPWSEPIDLNFNEGIDPGHVADADGKRYLYFSNGGYVPLSDDGLSVIGDFHHSYDGWPIPREWTIECFCLEGPKFIKRGEYYYLITAQGGTAGPATGHMIVVARSKSPLGPWENSPYNPIIRTTSHTERWCSKGHGTPFEDHTGNWWMIYHAYEKNFYNMGRQTMLEPIEWTADGWFKTPDGVKSDAPIKRPSLSAGKPGRGTLPLSDDFGGTTLRPHWKFFGGYDPNRFRFENSALVMQAKGNGVGNCSPMLCVPSHHSYTIDVEINIEGNATAGLVLFYNNNFHSGILADRKDIIADLRGWQFPTEKSVIQGKVFLRLKNVRNLVDMYYSLDGNNWIKIENSADVSSMHHNVLSGFMSLRVGLCAYGEDAVSFKNFRYIPIDEELK